ncbi:MAG TPA: lipase family protein, partial [Acidimicrobiales bacterium]|nr:lipase family protein [Acidimicrobiales bacterium]
PRHPHFDSRQAEQLLYRTTDHQGEPSVTVTTVLEPAPAPPLPRIVEYLSFCDGLGSQCDPSYTLAGGDPGGSTNEQAADEEELLVSWYLSQDDIVTIPDFEGTGLDWMAGWESGYGALDAIRATESYLGVGAKTEVGLSGYSGGSVAADWASEVAPAYAPELNIVGVAEGGIPADYVDMFDYVNGRSEYAVAIPGMLVGLSRAYGVDLDRYLSSYGQQVVGQLQQVCMASVFGTDAGLTIDQLMLPQYQNLAEVAPFAQMLGDQTMGIASTPPREPLLMGVGNSDGTGDGVMVAADVEALARHYCQQGVPVDFQEYTGASHEEAGAFFEPQTGPFLQARFAGAPFVSNCSSLSSSP